MYVAWADCITDLILLSSAQVCILQIFINNCNAKVSCGAINATKIHPKIVFQKSPAPGGQHLDLQAIGSQSTQYLNSGSSVIHYTSI